MKALVYHGAKDIRHETIDDPAIVDDGDVILRVERTAICGSDLHLWHGGMGSEGGFAVGHEFLGTVEDVGRGVTRVRKGDRMLASCTVGCGSCVSCQRGLWSGCSTQAAFGPAAAVFGMTNALPGGQAEAVRVPYADHVLFDVPEGLDDEQVLFLTDILPTGYMGADYADVQPGDTVVVFGCGPVGTFAQMSASLRGAAQVIAVDIDSNRLARARKRGFETINSSEEDVVERVMELTRGIGADSAIEAVGRAELITQAGVVVRPGGHVAVIGVMTEPIAPLPFGLFFLKNITIRTGLVNPHHYIPRLMASIEQGRIDPSEIISHRLPLSDGPRAYEIFANRDEDVLKIVLTP